PIRLLPHPPPLPYTTLFRSKNPDAPRQYRPDGSAYGENEIVPFMIDSPFFEFAFDETTNEVVGVRLGFGESMGILSGKIETLTTSEEHTSELQSRENLECRL